MSFISRTKKTYANSIALGFKRRVYRRMMQQQTPWLMTEKRICTYPLTLPRLVYPPERKANSQQITFRSLTGRLLIQLLAPP